LNHRPSSKRSVKKSPEGDKSQGAECLALIKRIFIAQNSGIDHADSREDPTRNTNKSGDQGIVSFLKKALKLCNLKLGYLFCLGIRGSD